MTPVDDDLLARYISGHCTPFERARIDRWLGESPDHMEFVMALREVAADTRRVSPVRKAEMLAAVKRSPAEVAGERPLTSGEMAPTAEQVRPGVPLPSRSFWSPALRVAAVLLLATAVAVGGRIAFRSAPLASSASALRSFATAPGQRLAFRLPDGTAVALAPASMLRLSADYGTRNRTVTLDGEAVFTVSHDPVRPFAVRTARGVARDLGTRFVVRSYADDSVTDVVVAEGIVAVIPDTAAISSHDSVVLRPGEGARLTAEGQVAVSRHVVLDPYFAWTTGRLVFRDTPLREAVTRMSRWYDVDIRLASSAIGDRPLTAGFDEDATADVLPLVAASLGLDLTQSGRIYTFRAK